jgi:hypothetical protein
MGFGQVSQRALAVFCCFLLFLLFCRKLSAGAAMDRADPAERKRCETKKQQTRLCSRFGVHRPNWNAIKNVITVSVERRCSYHKNAILSI